MSSYSDVDCFDSCNTDNSDMDNSEEYWSDASPYTNSGSDTESDEDPANEGGYRANVIEFCDVYSNLQYTLSQSTHNTLQSISTNSSDIDAENFVFHEAFAEVSNIQSNICDISNVPSSIRDLVDRCMEILDVIQEYS